MTVVEHLEIGVRQLTIERPRDPEALIDEERFVQDEFLPYWAELWPSGLALARHVAALDLAGATVLELGCGLALPSLAAALAGAEVLATDWSAAALDLAQRNAAANGAQLRTALLEWEQPAGMAGTFDLVLAADVLYEARQAEPLLALLARVVAVGGATVVADPGRRHAPAFFDAAARAGYGIATTTTREIPRGGIYRLSR